MEIVFFLLMQFLRHVFKVALKELIYLQGVKVRLEGQVFMNLIIVFVRH